MGSSRLAPLALQAALALGGLAGFRPAALAILLVIAAFLVLDPLLGVANAAAGSADPLVARTPHAMVAVQLAAIAAGVAAAGAADAGDFAGLALGLGLGGGIFATLAAHELIHSRSRSDRALGIVMLAAIGYPQFRVSHIFGHHALAATPRDPATARRGETVYGFALRTVIAQTRHAWACEAARAAAAGRPPWRNQLTVWAAATMAACIGIWLTAGAAGLLLFASQSAIAVFVLEAFEYVVHYGLERGVDAATGKPEPFRSDHAWNTTRRFSNAVLLGGGHHSDHHRAPARGFQSLAAIDGAPELPFGYAGMMLVALVPPLWFRTMNDRLPALASGPIASVS